MRAFNFRGGRLWRRLLFGGAGFVAILLASLVAANWLCAKGGTERRATQKLRVSFVNYADAPGAEVKAVVRLENKSKSHFLLEDFLILVFEGEGEKLLLGAVEDVKLPPHGDRLISFDAPTNGPRWRILVGAIEKREIDRKCRVPIIFHQ